MISSAGITPNDASISMFYFGDSNYSDVQIENVFVSDYYLASGFYFENIGYSDVYMNNMTFGGKK